MATPNEQWWRVECQRVKAENKTLHKQLNSTTAALGRLIGSVRNNAPPALAIAIIQQASLPKEEKHGKAETRNGT